MMSLLRNHQVLIGGVALALLGLAVLGSVFTAMIREKRYAVRIVRGRLAQRRMERRASAERERAAAKRRRDIRAGLQEGGGGLDDC